MQDGRLADIHPLRGSKQKPTTLPSRGKCQSAGDVALLKDGPRRGVITAPQLGVEFRLHFGAGVAGLRGDRGGAEPGERPQHGGAAVARGGGAAEAAGSQTKLPAQEAPEASAATCKSLRGGRARAASWGSRLLRLRRSRGGGGPTAATAPGPHKEETGQLVGPQPRRRGLPRGAGDDRAGTPGGARRGKGTSCLGPPPRADSRVLRDPDPEGRLSSHRVPDPTPTLLTHPKRL